MLMARGQQWSPRKPPEGIEKADFPHFWFGRYIVDLGPLRPAYPTYSRAHNFESRGPQRSGPRAIDFSRKSEMKLDIVRENAVVTPPCGRPAADDPAAWHTFSDSR